MFDFLKDMFSSKIKIYKNLDEVANEATKKNRIYIVYKNDVYDVTSYAKIHPGGEKLMKDHNSKNVDKIFDKYHWPRSNARNIMKRYKIGKIMETYNSI